ncbi:MAG: hypothetical protein KDD02_22520 [Phaeodactylibacter sp.]|nr:hypothetical protein [Phaeodactylibacter sp.]MCB9082687.1 hypothetical protein [Lewinellaceae bacterium]HQU60287.1 hypothetical protein [Saprospiraceae bacterium]
MKRFAFFAVSLSLVLLVVNGCYYDVEEELYPIQECNTNNVTYSGIVAPIIQNNCLQCHSAAANLGNVVLEGYDNLKGFADSGRLLGAVKHQSGYSPMPQSAPQLGDCLIARIEQWIDDGAPNN